jgi:hypothetical protein
VIDGNGADEHGRETFRRLAADIDLHRGKQRVAKVIADQSVLLDAFSAGPNLGTGTGEHTRCDAD